MSDTQPQLFPDDPPNLPQGSLFADLTDEENAIREASDFAAEMLRQRLVSSGELYLSAEEFVEILTGKFGYGIRLHLPEIVKILQQNGSIGNYAKAHLTVGALQEILRGKNEKQRPNDESTLDELFARTLQLRSSDKLKEVIEFVARLREYSAYNNMLVKLQRPTARYYATASHWKRKFKREVKPEALPIVILRPMGPVMLVYDVEDTTGEKLPSQIENPFTISGDFNTDFYYQVCLNCKKIGIEIKEANLTKSHAGSAIRETQDANIKLIVRLNRNHDIKLQYATLCHELAHLFLGHLGGDPFGKEWNSRIGLTLTQRELEAEAVSYILCVRAGLISNSAEYLSTYLDNPDDIKEISVEVIIRTVTYIEQMTLRTFRPRTRKTTDAD